MGAPMLRPQLAALVFLIAVAVPAPAASAREPIAGRWEMAGGVVELSPAAGGFTSRWIRQRAGLSCPSIEDRDGDMRLHGSGGRYSGTWTWSLHDTDGSCTAIGRGPMTLTVASGGRTARLSGTPPAGYKGRESHELTRLGGNQPGELEPLSSAQRAVLAYGAPAAPGRPELASLAAVGLLPGARLDALPRLRRLPVGFSG
jgi:hypothetical protein